METYNQHKPCFDEFLKVVDERRQTELKLLGVQTKLRQIVWKI
jgi:hypothetical protein